MSSSLIPSIYDPGFRIVPKWDNYRSYGFCCLAYQEWPFINDCLKRVMNLPCKYFGISPIHDKDFLENGKPDKPHYHIILKFPNARSAHQVARDYLFTCQIFPLKSFRGAVRYFCHADDPDKFQYDKDDIICSDYEKTFAMYTDLLSRDNSDEFDLLNFLDNINWLIQKGEFRTELEMIKWIFSNGYGQYFNRFKFALHNTFSDYRKDNLIYNTKNERII